MRPRILIAGIGNIFLGDDAFGCEVIQRLVRREWPENVRIEDFGIRGFDLAYALMEEYDVVILVDAVPRGGEPGALYTIEPDWSALDQAGPELMTLETHGMNPMKVLAMVKAMGGRPRKLLLVGCEPSMVEGEEDRMGLSEPVQAALDNAVEMLHGLIANFAGSQKTAVTG